MLEGDFDARDPGGAHTRGVGTKEWIDRESWFLPCCEFSTEGDLGGVAANALQATHAVADPDHSATGRLYRVATD